MRLVFIYGPVAAGKLTVGRLVAERTGFPLFHNHLIVDAVASVFPFGSDDFIRLRERFWLETISTAARIGQSLIFTFAPEPSVTTGFADQLTETVTSCGGEVVYVALTLNETEQERRLVSSERARFGKLQSVDVLREHRTAMNICMSDMPQPTLCIDTGCTSPVDATDFIIRALDE
ncbi:shikimate kinase [uncultured Sphingomonas sp.]|uniref:shikimate kinase n=1 Tax=uncultured Sphingomonas sp. TaxID=158754 RepID=UPI0035CBBB51